jgi:Na+-translocating ferredoxin:NAD+ oxidoreductase RNF subunit RnfB
VEKIRPLSPYVRFNKELCTGCIDCVRICPIQAVRIKKHIPLVAADQCIGCGECIRICPAGAVSAPTSEMERLDPGQISVALVSPVLYSQFPGVTPEDVLQGLRQMGFRHAVDMSYFLEMFQCATEEFIIKNRQTNDSPWPLISPICPVVVRLIAFQFPSLLSNILPVMRPVSLMAREVNRQIVREYRIKEEKITLYYIVPCQTKMEPSRTFFLKEQPYKINSLGFNDIYGELTREIQKIQKGEQKDVPPDCFNYRTGSNSLIWGLSGGEIAGMSIEGTLAVSGLKETISYLEKIEMGQFQDMEYIEFRTCSEGCLGGILTAIDRYLAKKSIQKILLKDNLKRRVSHDELINLYGREWFSKKSNPYTMRRIFGVKKEPLSLKELNEIDRLVTIINGKNCAACGSPGCRAFAEDVVRGNASIDDCLELRARGISEKDIFKNKK